MASDEADEARLAEVFAAMRPALDERQWRRLLGAEARSRGRGGIAAVARASGCSESTVTAGAREIAAEQAGEAEPLPPGRSRRPGGGRKKAEDRDTGLRRALLALVDASTRGDPMSPLRWTTLSLRDLERRLGDAGFRAGKDTVARILRDEGYSLQAHSRVIEGKQHEDRDAQFRYIAAMIAEFTAAGDPVVSVDCKKKEKLGLMGRAGRCWRPAGDPVRVRDHDWEDPKAGRAVPYGIYDIAANTGFVVVGRSHETPAFAASCLRRWWLEEGSLRCPHATRLLVTCDAGGSNGAQFLGWKDGLARLAAETGLRITVCHFPPGTSKWNKIEHRLFSHVTRTWRARPLETMDDVTAGIAATVTAQGLKCTAVRDDADWPTGREVPRERARYLKDHLLDRHEFHGEWNYALLPSPRLGPLRRPAAVPNPRVDAGLLNHPALTGMREADVLALAGALAGPHQQAHEKRLAAKRGGRDRKRRAGRTSRISVLDRVLALRMRRHLDLPTPLVGLLLGISEVTVSQVYGEMTRLIEETGITLPPAEAPPAPVRSREALLAHAAGAGLRLTIPEPAYTGPTHYKRKRKPAPETTNLKTDGANLPYRQGRLSRTCDLMPRRQEEP